jgi:hypothetical protein
MKPEDHAVIVGRAFGALEKFSLPEDAAVLIEGTYVVAYHALNGLMHKEGALPEDHHINSPAHSPLTLDKLPEAARPVWQAFEDLQELRIAYVWSPGTPGDDLQKRLEGFWRIFRAANRLAKN